MLRLRHLFAGILALCFLGALLSSSPRPAEEPKHGKAYVLAATRAVGGSGFSDEGTVIQRDASGRFHVQARVNGEDATFLVDTGADVVALTEAEAERLGFDVSPDDFRPIMETASGTGYGARIYLDRLELGDEEYDNVDAVVVRGLGTNLLGQSALRRLGKVELQGDRMIIRHE
jgi:aspartyl protease family protein